MDLITVVTQIKGYVSPLGNRVSGCADFATGLETVVNLTLPAAFVYPTEDEAGENGDWPGLRQDVSEHIAVTVEFDNTVSTDADRRTGFAGVNQVYAMRSALWAALLSWIPPDQTGRAARGFRYGGGRMLTFDRARLFWQFEFILDTLVTDADGFPLRGGTPITVEGTLTVPGTPGDGPAIIFDIPHP